MKKKLIFGLLGLLSASTLCFVGCGDDENSSVADSSVADSSVEQTLVSVNITDAALTMDYFETRALEVETENADTVVWESSDPSVVSVDDKGVLTANIKDGTVTITAKCGDVSDTCTVAVMRKSALPSFSVETNLTLLKGTSYTVTGTLTYNGLDVSSYATYGFNDGADAQTAVSAALDANKWTFTANESGSATFTVYATIFGQTYSETVTIAVKEADVVYLLRDATLNGDVNEFCIRKGLKEYAAYYTSNVEIYDKGEKVDSASLTWTVADSTIAEVAQDGKIVGKKEGITTISATYKDTLIDVQIHVLKDRINYASQEVQDIDLNLGISAYATDSLFTTGARVLTPNYAQLVSFAVGESGVSYGSLISVKMDGESLDADMFSLADGKVSVLAGMFGTETYGEKTFEFEAESEDVVYHFTVKALLITKTISDLTEFRSVIPTKWKGDKNFGYYVLDADIDCAGYYICGDYATDFNYANGFRGTLDGRNFKIKNYVPSSYGIASQIGNGAVIKNIVFDNVNYVGEDVEKASRAIIARGIGGATIENIVINLAEESTPEIGSILTGTKNRGGMIAHVTKNNVFKDITVNGKNHEIHCLMGINEATSTIENDNVNNAIVVNHATQSPVLAGIEIKGIVKKFTGVAESGGKYEYVIEKDGAFAMGEHVAVYVDGSQANDSLLGWVVADESVAKIEDGKVVPVAEGKTTVSTTYEGVDITIHLTVQILDRVAIKATGVQDVDLDLGFTDDAAAKKRTFTVNETAKQSVTFTVENGKDYGTVTNVTLDGASLDASKFSFANGTFTFNTSAFGTETYGEKTLIIEMTSDATVYKFETKVLVITKTMSTKAELEAALDVKVTGYMIDGYYVLDADLDFAGAAMNTTLWVNDWSHKTGFVGTFDGKGHTISNYKAYTNGFIGQVSEGAVFKNITFDGVLRSKDTDVVIARGMGYATVENVTINFDASADVEIWDGTTSSAGLIAMGTMAVNYKNLTINAQGKTITKVFTRENDNKATFSNVVINAAAVVYYFGSVSTTPEGITLNTGANA